jgi:hypothetical protein
MNMLSLQDLCPALSAEEIVRIARECGFSKRAKKNAPEKFLSFLCQESIKGTVSYNDLASKLSSETDCDASRQAYYYRTKKEAVEFFKHILAAVMKHKYNMDSTGFPCRFKRILIQDSTIIRLPDTLYEIFSGVKNASTTVCNARIQSVYDLLSGTFVLFTIDTYSENDLKVAPKIEVQEGDLVLRDRGYFVTASIEKMKKQGADSISRYKHKMIFYDPHTHKEIDLLKRLQREGSLDIRVVSNVDKNTILRIMASPIPEEVANIRRMKVRKEAKGRTCSYEYLQLLGWAIFITTIEDENFTMQQVGLFYSLRWRIECIFKTWKSDLNFDKIHTVSQIQLRVLLYARFIMITLLYERLYKPLEIIVSAEHGKQLSLMKFMRFMSRNFCNVCRTIFQCF